MNDSLSAVPSAGLSSELVNGLPSPKKKLKDSWSATPGLRQQWLKTKQTSISTKDFLTILNDSQQVPDKELQGIENQTSESFKDFSETFNISKSISHEKSMQDINAPQTLESESSYKNALACIFQGTPGVLIAVILNLFLSTSFGLAFFPTNFNFPSNVPRAIGVQMFLFATFISQIILTKDSQFTGPIGMMMVENIPFMHAICDIATAASKGDEYSAMATILYTYALSSIVVGIFFYILGNFKLGNTVYFFPKHIIVGCIGGIGVFIFQTGVEATTSKTWSWDIDIINSFFKFDVAKFWLAALVFEIILRILTNTRLNGPLLSPFYFISIPPIFYFLLMVLGIPVREARAGGWFFEPADDANPLLMWELMNITRVNWSAVATSIPTIVALTLFSLMHVPINIPSLSLSVKERVDMNNELKAHGISNVISGLLGGLQNYLCYSNSLLYFKCNGRGKVSGYVVAVLVAFFFIVGPSTVQHVPRCMAGCLLMHVGIDLTKEAVWDSRAGLDSIEYYSVILITLVMTFYGMTAGLVFGVICAAITFTLQVSNHVSPVRGMMRASTLRSSKWRSIECSAILDKLSRRILVIQLQGQLFFANATTFASEIDDILRDDVEHDISFIILDFTLVLAIDSSAAETIANIFEICKKYDVKLCYSRPSQEGFPCAVELSERLKQLTNKPPVPHVQPIFNSDVVEVDLESYFPQSPSLTRRLSSPEGSVKRKSVSRSSKIIMRNNGFLNGEDMYEEEPIHGGVIFSNGYHSLSNSPIGEERPSINSVSKSQNVREYFLSELTHLSDSLDGALIWCEDQLLTAYLPSYDYTDPFKHIKSVKGRPAYLKQMHALASSSIPSNAIDRLFSHFEYLNIPQGTVLWRQGDDSDRAIILESGRLLHSLEEEAGTLEMIEVGHLVGEYGLISCNKRYGTLIAVQPSVGYVLTREKYEKITAQEPFLSLVLSNICLGYLGRRVQHVSNRIWESRCVPV